MPVDRILSRRRRRWLVAAAVVGIPAIMVGLLWAFQRRLIYQPDASPVPPAAEVFGAGAAGAQDVTLSTADGLTLGAYFLPPTHETCATTVLVLPGNAGNRWGRAPLAAGLAERGYGVLLVDYRGYGGNPGAPTEAGLNLDADAARAFLDGRLPAGTPILYLGESIGGSPATGLALRRPPAGTLLRSPFVDLASTAQEHYPFVPVRWLLREQHPVLDRVTELAGRGLVVDVVHGRTDAVVPAEQSARVAGAAAVAGGQVTVVDADHNDPELAAGPQLLDAVDRLAGRVACRPRR